MDNISTICAHLWRKARRHVLAPRKEEADAVRDMRDLYTWGEIISQAFQSDDLEGNGKEWESALESLEGRVGSDVWAAVGEVGKDLCEWMGNDEALRVCERVVGDSGKVKERRSREAFACLL
jgi:hypothetical protein